MPLKDIGPFRVVDTLGSGGAGTVYRAVDRRNNETVAVKLLRVGFTRDPRSARRLAREFEALAELSHPNVVRVYETGVHEGYPFLAMELVEGLTLRSYLSLSGPSAAPSRPTLWALEDDTDTHAGPRRAPREARAGEDAEDDEAEAFDLAAFAEEPPSEEFGELTPPRLRAVPSPSRTDTSFTDTGLASVFGVRGEGGDAPDVEALNRPERVARLKEAMVQLSEALAYIHSHGLVHRDLKPTNVMVDEDRVVRLMDFGLAKFLADEAHVTQEGRQVGTFRYMSPEQILGEPLDARTDLYSLGVLLYELLAGRPPFDGQTPDALWDQVLEMEAPPLHGLNRDVDPQLARIAHRLLRKEPEQRYQTAEEVYEALVE